MQELANLAATTDRQWLTYATVDPQAGDDQSVEFDEDMGPLVHVKLHPSGSQVRARVAGWCAGNGEGSWFPLVDGDELLVAVPEGDERAGCVVVGRTNNQIDRFPTVVGGQDVTRNTVAFQRTRCPFILESEHSILLTCATAGNYALLSKEGNVTIADGYKNFLHLGADFVGLNMSDDEGNVKGIVQLDRQDGLFTVEISNSGKISILNDGTATWMQGQSISLQAAGMVACEHLVSIEAVANVVAGVLVGLAAYAAPGSLAGLAVPGVASTMVASAIALASTPAGDAFQLYSAAVNQAIQAGLAAKLQNLTGLKPGAGCPGLMGG